MSARDLANNEVERLSEQLSNGEITETEYRRYIREIERDLAEFERQGH